MNNEDNSSIKSVCLSKVHEIAQVIKAVEIGNNGLLNGNSGITIFLYHYSKYTQKKNYNKYANILLEKIFDNLDNLTDVYSFSAGVGGVGWTIEYLNENDFIKVDPNVILEDIDDLLIKKIKIDIKNKNIDLLYGLIGSGVYFLSRKSNNRQIEYIDKIIEGLISISEKDIKNRMIWKSFFDVQNGKERYDLGLAHGNSSVIVFLSKCLQLSKSEKIEVLLRNLIGFMFDNVNPEGSYSVFPNWTLLPEDLKNKSRLAWCYGDLGISMALYQAGKALKDTEIINKSVNICLSTTNRKSHDETAIKDAGICHGSSGLAYMYNIMYNNTGNKEFKKASEYWLNETINLAKFDDGLAGYKVWTDEGYKVNYALLEGISGIGLVFLSFLTNEISSWDRALLLS